MIDVKSNAKMVSELERLLMLARSGQFRAIGFVGIRQDGTGDVVLEMHPEPILVPALSGSLIGAAQYLTDAQIRDGERQMMKSRGSA